MNKKIILFDIDDTLVDVHPMARKFYQKIADHIGISLEAIITTKEKYSATLERYSDYYPDELLNFIYDFFEVSSNKRINPFIEDKYYLESLFPEVKPVIEKLKNDYKLGIFSEGFVDYQSRKIQGLTDLLEKDLVFIERRKLSPESINKIPTGAVVIDDKRIVIETLASIRPDLSLFWINRQNDEKIETPKIRTISSLDGLIESDDKSSDDNGGC